MEGNTGRIIHVAAEVVLLSGVIFYFNTQIKSLKNEIKELKIKIDESTEGNSKHLNNLYTLVDKLNRSVENMQLQITEKHSPMSTEETGVLRRRPVVSNNPGASGSRARATPTGRRTGVPVTRASSERIPHRRTAVTEQVVDEEEILSREIGEELEEMEQEDEEEHQEESLSKEMQANQQGLSQKKN